MKDQATIYNVVSTISKFIFDPTLKSNNRNSVSEIPYPYGQGI
jgi:hypothetical protein